MEPLSKEKNLILGLLLGMAIAIAIPYAQPSELGASEEAVPAQEVQMQRAIKRCLDGSLIGGQMIENISFLRIQTRC